MTQILPAQPEVIEEKQGQTKAKPGKVSKQTKSGKEAKEAARDATDGKEKK